MDAAGGQSAKTSGIPHELTEAPAACQLVGSVSNISVLEQTGLTATSRRLLSLFAYVVRLDAYRALHLMIRDLHTDGKKPDER